MLGVRGVFSQHGGDGGGGAGGGTQQGGAGGGTQQGGGGGGAQHWAAASFGAAPVRIRRPKPSRSPSRVERVFMDGPSRRPQGGARPPNSDAAVNRARLKIL
jgi:hypothetical protein